MWVIVLAGSLVCPVELQVLRGRRSQMIVPPRCGTQHLTHKNSPHTCSFLDYTWAFRLQTRLGFLPLICVHRVRCGPQAPALESRVAHWGGTYNAS